MVVDRIPVLSFQPDDGGAEADGFHDWRGASFEAMGSCVVGHAFACDRFDHLSPALERRQGFQLSALAVQDADAGGTVELVAREGVIVRIERADIDLHVHDGLAAIKQYVGAGRMRKVDGGLHG